MFTPNQCTQIEEIRSKISLRHNGKEIAIYSTIFNNFEPIIPGIIGSGPLWDSFIITDGSVTKFSDDVQMIVTPFQFRNPRMSAKFFKICPHRIFSKYKYSLYIDGNCVLLPNIEELLSEKCISNNRVAFFRHNKRNCAYSELLYCMLHGKEGYYNSYKLLKKFLCKGFPRFAGLIQGGFVLRQHNLNSVKNIMDEWWDHIVSFTERDQILFNYLAWKHNFNIDYIEGMLLHKSRYSNIVRHNTILYGKKGNRKFPLRAQICQFYYDNFIKTKLKH